MNEYDKVKAAARKPEEKEVREETIREVERVVTRTAKPVKKGLVERMVVAMIGPNGLPRVGQYVTKEVIGPGVRDMLVDTVINGIQMLVYRDGQPPVTNRNRGGRGYSSSPKKTDYAAKYKHSQPPYREDPSRNTWAQDSQVVQSIGVGSILSDWAIPDRGEAQQVLERLTESAYRYGNAKVREYYDYIGVRSVYTDNNYGWSWEALMNTRIRTTRDGYVLDLPGVEAI